MNYTESKKGKRRGISAAIRAFIWIALLIHLPPASSAELKEYTIAGDSMSPALLPGDKVVIDSDMNKPIGRGDIVSFVFKTSNVPLIKRIAGIPGDSVEFKQEAVWINGGRARAIDSHRWSSTIKQIERFGNKIPEGYILSLEIIP